MEKNDINNMETFKRRVLPGEREVLRAYIHMYAFMYF